MITRIVLFALCLSIFLSTSFAQDPRCKPRAEMIKALKGSRFSESVFATGRAGKAVIIEFFVNAVTGTFTVVATRVISRKNGKIVGTSCILVGGGGFQFHEDQPIPEPTKHTLLNLPFYGLQ